MEKCDLRITELVKEQDSSAFDAERLIAISAELSQLQGEKAKLEEEWLQVTLSLDA